MSQIQEFKVMWKSRLLIFQAWVNGSHVRVFNYRDPSVPEGDRNSAKVDVDRPLSGVDDQVVAFSAWSNEEKREVMRLIADQAIT